ncbi:polyphosphate kinase 2 family protein [Aminobacter sp. AP02]|uniref:polyphosphate kinase 2 family protein n=1 Tax=Aminobacter sp. AP02 TaxID=2135737 RepID=UPI000D6BDC4C|nr:polyphosphate kinase 2 family protein [Aminobacter sp. AP02]PWK68473.1 PPK2 family polyphosphate:nucleotide phosphotransferase [Aminobacter sp. AP02]
MLPAEIVKTFRVKKGRKFQLGDCNPGDTCGLDIEKDDAKELLEAGVKRLRGLQERLYAEGRWSVLIVLQAMDAAGKDSAIEHVMSGVNPQGCDVTSFKAPSSTELRHDYLWRCAVRLPERGRVGIFNRSYYEEVLVARVHPEILASQNLPPDLVTDDIWKERFEDICTFEKHLARNGTILLKFFLHVSKDEQKRRFMERIEDPEKRWKFSSQDLVERQHWSAYMDAYEDMIRHTATKSAPWHVVPADNKWFTRLVIAATIVDRLQKLDPKFPEVGDEVLQEMDKARKQLADEKS